MAVQLRALDHVTLRTRDLDASLAFYREVLGLEIAVADPEGAVDHFAIAGAGSPETAKAELTARNIDFDERETPDGRFRQLFVRDPDGVKIEIVFDQQRPAG